MRKVRTNGSLGVALVAVGALLVGCGGAKEPGERATPPSTSGDGLRWVGDFETGDLSQYGDTPWNIHGGALPPEIVTQPVREGRYAVALTIPGTSNGEGITDDSRSELQPRLDDIEEGDELWFAFSVRLGEDYPVDAAWQTITQWKNDGEGSPPVELSAQDGSWVVAGGAGHPDDVEPFAERVAPAVAGEWVDWVFRIRFSADPEVGEIEVWKDGELVLPTFRPQSGTMYPPGEHAEHVEPSSYLKTGYYRAGSISEPATVYYDAWRVGTSAEAVLAAT